VPGVPGFALGTAPTDAVDTGPAYSFGLSLIGSLIRLRSRASAEAHRLRPSPITDGPGLARTRGRVPGKRVGGNPQEFESPILRHR